MPQNDPTPPGRKTGAVARPTGRLPASRATARVPSSATGKRIPRTATGTQRAPAAEARPPGPNPVYIAAGAGGAILLLLLLLFSRGGGPRRASGDYAQKRFDEASDFYSQQLYPEADNVLHDLLARKSHSKTEAWRRAEAFHADLHPLAETERGARRDVPGWLDRAGQFLANATSVDEGAALYEEGRRLADRYARSTYKEAMDVKLGDLGRYKGQKESDAAFARYQEVADGAKALRASKAFGKAIRLWRDLKGTVGLDPIAASKIGSRILEIQHEARAHVEELGRQAQALRSEGKAADARRLLESARPGLQDTEALSALESLLGTGP